MKSLLAILAVVCVTCTAPARTEADEALDKLQGKWTVATFEYNQTPVPEMLGAIREFMGDRYMLTPKTGETYTGTVKLDAVQTPKQIDLVLPDRTLKGIYELEDGTLKIAYALEGDARPTDFTSAQGSGVVLVVHKRPE